MLRSQTKQKPCEEKLVGKIHFPITAAGDAHPELVKAVSARLEGHEVEFKPFLDGLKKRIFTSITQN